MIPLKKKKVVKKKLQDESPQKSVRVRMYDVGFGDGFILFIPDGDKIRTVVLDCGSIKSGDLGSIDAVARRMVADIEKETGTRRVDVVIATHRHKDHVSGFASQIWSQVDVGEVWMPWTEDPRDPEATRIREKQASLALALESHDARRGVSTMVTDLAVNALSNDKAMETLHRGFQSRATDDPLYLPHRDRAKATFRSTNLPGVLVRVLGPARVESIIKDMDPPSGESYLAALSFAQSDQSGEDANAPFARGITRTAYRQCKGNPLNADVEAHLRSAGLPDDLELAATLEAAVNGTSLMLVLDIGRARLLLPGDAQWGTWKLALEDSEWGAILAQANFYKIGHHGSHNATPVKFVEKYLMHGIPAMASVRPMAKWKNIPRTPLLAALAAKGVSVVRSDEPQKASTPRFRRADDDAWIETWIPV